MLDTNSFFFNAARISGAVASGGAAANAWPAARALYDAEQRKAAWARIWTRLRRRSPYLRPLAATGTGPCDRHYAGATCVAIDRIKGSECRWQDFDRDFRSLGEHNRQRWVRVAAGRLQGLRFAPVELVQVGDDYFVRDGHHRISVARALGEEFIEASVTVWQAA